MSTLVVSSKGQRVLPAALRRRLVKRAQGLDLPVSVEPLPQAS